jgi:hypothetical protein
VVSVLTPNRQRLEGATLGSFLIPDELSSFLFRDRFFAIQTFHFSALTTEEGDIQARLEIVLLNANPRSLCVDESEVRKGTDHFTEMAPAALRFFDLDFHIPAWSFRRANP